MPPPPVPLTQLLTPLLCFKGQKLAVNQEHLECTTNSNMAKKVVNGWMTRPSRGIYTHTLTGRYFTGTVFVLYSTV